MNKKLINIAVLEQSQIIFEGLSNIFSKTDQYFKLFRIESFDELQNLIGKEKIDVVIINPYLIQNREKEFSTTKKSKPEICWAAFVYTFFNQQQLSLFEKIIHITDKPDDILRSIKNIGDTNSQAQPNNDHEQLTDREMEVLKLLVAGMSNKEIADKLFISVHTVVSHRKNISQKTGIKSQSGLTIYAISNKIINIENFSN